MARSSVFWVLDGFHEPSRRLINYSFLLNKFTRLFVWYASGILIHSASGLTPIIYLSKQEIWLVILQNVNNIRKTYVLRYHVELGCVRNLEVSCDKLHRPNWQIPLRRDFFRRGVLTNAVDGEGLQIDATNFLRFGHCGVNGWIW